MKIIINKKLEEIILDEKRIIKTIGPVLSKSLKLKINQILSFNNFYEYKVSGIGKPHPLDGELNGCYAVHLSANYRLCVKPLIDDLSNNGLKQCNEIELKGVLDYHGDKYNWLLR